MQSDAKGTRPKVVAINSNGKPEPLSASDRARLARLPAPVHAVKERGKQLFSNTLRDLFDNADDALFALADKATSNQDQNLFFESMREIRIRRRDLESAFADAIDNAFVALLTRDGSRENDRYGRDATAQSLALVQEDELEELVAIDSLISRANKACGENLQYLSLRLDSLVPNKVYHKTNPLGPDIICGAFVTASRKLDADINAKLVLFKLFDEYVVSELPKIYDLLNQTLIEHNVLPSLKHQPARDDKETAPSGDSRASQRAGEASAGDTIHVSISASELVAALSHLQALNSSPTVSSAAPSASAVDTDIGKLLLKTLQEQHGEGQLAQGQAETINLVQLLFDFILDDRNLAEPMKVLLARMQIPILKVALLDESFFKRNGHPARRLLNEMATASLGWQAPADAAALAKDPLYRTAEGLVQRLLQDFGTDLALLNDLLADFVSFVEKERRRASILEQRTIDAEDGKARAEAVRQDVNAAIAEIVAGRRLPGGVDKILEGAWSNVLFLTALKQGRGSEEWQQALQTADDLVWSVTADISGGGRQRLLGMIPHLVKRLHEGLERISYNPFELTQLLSQLEKVHIARLIPGADVAAELDDQDVTMDNADAAGQISEPQPPHSQGESSHTESLEQVPDKALLADIDKLTQGSWFEMNEGKGRTYRCRLAAIIKPTGKYIFVNRSGMKVAEKTRDELAAALRDKRLSLLDDTMLFDRALESVIGSLRKPG